MYVPAHFANCPLTCLSSHATLDRFLTSLTYIPLKVDCALFCRLKWLTPITGKIKEPNQAVEAGKGAMQAMQSYAKGDMGGVFKAGMGIFKVATGASDKATKIARETKGSQADVVCDFYSTDSADLKSVLTSRLDFVEWMQRLAD